MQSRIVRATRCPASGPPAGPRRTSAGNGAPRRRRTDSSRSTPAGRRPGSTARSATRTSIEQPSRSWAGQPKSCSAPGSTRSMRPLASTSITASGTGARLSRGPSSSGSTITLPILAPGAAVTAGPAQSYHTHARPGSRTEPDARTWREGVRCDSGCGRARSGTTQPRPRGGRDGTAAPSHAVERTGREPVRLAPGGGARGGPRRPRLRRAQRPDRPAQRAGRRAVRLRPRRAARGRGGGAAAPGPARRPRGPPCRLQRPPAGAVDGVGAGPGGAAPRRVRDPGRGQPGAVARGRARVGDRGRSATSPRSAPSRRRPPRARRACARSPRASTWSSSCSSCSRPNTST